MISLIVSTRNRIDELERFLAHLDAQTYLDFEVLLVDQNSGDGVAALLKRHAIPQQYFRSDKLGIAPGRNVALEFMRGDIFAIPDDDCWYPPELLQKVAQWFDQHPDVGMLCILECNEKGEAMVPKNPPPAGFCTDQPIGLFMERSVWMMQSSMVFLRRSVRDTLGNMDESIGVGSGSKYQSGEETDYLLRAMHAGFKIWFEPSLKVLHPELRELQRTRKTNYPYAVGNGHLLRKHYCSLPRLMAVVCRALGGAVLSACRFDAPMVAVYCKRAIGILVGYSGW